MAISAYPFDGQDTTEDQYSRLFTELQDSGVAAGSTSSEFAVTATGSTMYVDIAPGTAIVRGHVVTSTAIESVLLVAPASGTRVDRIVLRLDPVANTITPVVVQGTVGGGAPSINDDPVTNATGIYDLPLARVGVNAGDVAITQSDITDERPFAGHRVGTWIDSARRPKAPRRGELGYNVQLGGYEFYTGSAWKLLGDDIVASSIPAGTVQMWAGASGSVPSGWLLCDGATYTNAAYPDLAAVLGTTYGGTAGSNFKVPNFTDRSPVGTSGTKARGATGGSATKTLVEANLPPHAHTINHNHGSTSYDGAHRHEIQLDSTEGGGVASVRRGRNDPDLGTFVNPIKDVASNHSHAIPNYTGNSGNGSGTSTPFDVMNPWASIYFIIKT